MRVSVIKKGLLSFVWVLLIHTVTQAQLTEPVRRPNTSSSGTTTGTTSSNRGTTVNGQKKDTLGFQKRDRFADSITIFYRRFDSSKPRYIDSNLNDFGRRFPSPYQYVTLGSLGTASRSLLFNPVMKSGWDGGFHQFDIYAFKLEETRFFQTTRPYTELNYILGSKAEQTIQLLHTQNKKSNFNFTFEYNFLNSPGSYKNQKNSHSGIRFNAFYNTPNRKYGAWFIFMTNSHKSSESGGLQDIGKLDSLALNDPYELDTRLGPSGSVSRNPFNTAVSTGNQYSENTLLYRHYYDLGKRDSLVTDSTVIQLFYPRLRFQHTFNLSSYSYQFIDNSVDSTRYKDFFNYDIASASQTTLSFKDKWSLLTNDFSIITFPDKDNLAQFIKVGAAYQMLTGTFDTEKNKYHNIYLIGEYRNRTRNRVWDIEASGNLYVNGYNSGDYNAYISLKRILSKNIGSLELGFHNVNRTPSSIYSTTTTFPVVVSSSLNKENITRLFATYENPKLDVVLRGEYFLVNNYTYFDSFFTAKQASSLFNVLHVSAEKKIRLTKYFNWYIDLHVQKTIADAPVNLPLVVARNRFAFEGNFFTNLFLSTGLEIRYYTNYKADNYSPFTGQFFYQNSFSTSNRPDVHAFMHFRIKSFKGFVRVENLNTLVGGSNKHVFTTAQYAGNANWTRFGVYWNFVN